MDEKRKILTTRSEELADIMEQVPHWLIRSGVLMLMFVLLLIFGGSYFFPYTEKILLPVKLIAFDPPVPVIVNSGGYIDKVCVAEGSEVEQEDYIIYLRDSEKPEEVFVLECLIDSLRKVNRTGIPNVPKDNLHFSGQFHLDYSELVSELKTLRLLTDYSLYEERIVLLDERIKRTQELIEDSRKQYSLREEEISLITGKMERDSILQSWRMLSLEEMEVSRRQYLSARSAFYDNDERLRSLELALLQLLQEKKENELSVTEEKISAMLRLDLLLDQTKARLEGWKMNHLITAPAAGKVYFNEELTLHMRLEAGKVIGLIVPQKVSSFKCTAAARGDEVVLIREGMLARLRIPGYESERGNHIEGIVSGVSNVGIGGLFKVSIELQRNISELSERFGVFYGLEGTAEIIVKKGRLFHKLLVPDNRNMKNKDVNQK